MSFLVWGLCELEPYQHVHLSTRSLVYSFTCLLVHLSTRQLVNLSTRQPVNSLTSQFVNSFTCLLVTPSLLTYPFTLLLAIIVIEPIGVAVNTAKGVNAFGTIFIFVLQILKILIIGFHQVVAVNNNRVGTLVHI